MNAKHILLTLSVFTLVSIAHGEREVFAPSKLAPTATAGTVLFGNGTQAAPAISFSADSDTGIYKNVADVSFSVNNSNKFHVSAEAGAVVAIGNQSGSSSSPVSGTLRATSGGGTNNAGANLTIEGGNSTGNAAGGYVAFRTAAAGASGSTANTLTERMRIDSAGRVGIGTTNPSARLHVEADNFSETAPAFRAQYTGGANAYFTPRSTDAMFGTFSNHSLLFNTNNMVRMSISAGGRIGMGTTSPLSKLHIVEPLATQFRVQDVETDSTNKFGTFATGHYTNSEEPVAALLVSNTSTGNSINIGGGSGSFNAATQLVFTTAANNTTVAGTERMRITSGGEIVAGNGDTSATPAAATIRGTDGNGTNIAGADITIRGGQSTGSGTGGNLILSTSGNSVSGTSLNAPVERMRVKSTGAVRFIPRGTPGSPEDGDVYYNSGTNKLQVRAAGVWVDLH